MVSIFKVFPFKYEMLTLQLFTREWMVRFGEYSDEYYYFWLTIKDDVILVGSYLKGSYIVRNYIGKSHTIYLPYSSAIIVRFRTAEGTASSSCTNLLEIHGDNYQSSSCAEINPSKSSLASSNSAEARILLKYTPQSLS